MLSYGEIAILLMIFSFKHLQISGGLGGFGFYPPDFVFVLL